MLRKLLGYATKHGDTTAIYDNSQNSLAEYTYDIYGNKKSESGTFDNPYRYTGQYYDVENGMYYLRARFYDPDLKRFITEDPAKDGGNWYAYCGNNPVTNPTVGNNFIKTSSSSVNGSDYQSVALPSYNEPRNLNNASQIKVKYQANVLAITGMIQGTDQCLATSGAMVEKYYNPDADKKADGTKMTDKELIDSIDHTIETRNQLALNGVVSYQVSHMSHYSFEKIKEELDNGYPLLITAKVYGPTTLDHAMVINGYKIINDIEYVIYTDPSDGEEHMINYDTFSNGNDVFNNRDLEDVYRTRPNEEEEK